MDLEQYIELADLFKNFADSSRLQIMDYIFEGEKSVGDIAEGVGMSQSAVSHQLRILKQNKLVKSRRSGKQIFYSLDDEHVHHIIEMGKEHIEE